MIVRDKPTVDKERPIGVDASSLRLQVLVAEHWSLLATRSLTYSESLSRVSMFLSVLSGAVVALALLAQVDHFRWPFIIAAVLVLSVVLFVGLATIGRLSALNREDWRSVMGMNRLRRGYLDMHPDLEPYFLTGSHDDLRGILLTMGMSMVPGRWSLREAGHGFQTLPAMLGVIVALLAGVLGALVAGWVGASMVIAVAVAAAVFPAMVVLLGFLIRRDLVKFARAMSARFPSEDPGSPTDSRRESLT